MKIITLPDGTKEKIYKPNEAARMLKYHPRTIRRLINIKRINAIDSNKNGIQPVWWIPLSEINRLKGELLGLDDDHKSAAKILKLKRMMETKKKNGTWGKSSSAKGKRSRKK